MDEPVQVKPALGRRIWSVDERQDGRGVVEAEPYGQATEVGLLVAEGREFPVDEPSGPGGFAKEVARLEVVVQQHWLDGVLAGLDFLVEASGSGAQGWGGDCVRSQSDVEVIGPAAVAAGSGESAEVRAGYAVGGCQGLGEFVQEAVGGCGICADQGLRGPRRCGVGVGGEQTRTWYAVVGE
ncbi:hypothetical protein OHT20_17620 [Streptomyces caniferus]|nr:hypothetical protein [Streptomyces caniferus]